MHVFAESTSELDSWIRREVEFDRQLARGSRGVAVKRVQEWLNLRGFGVVVDSKYGPVTADAVTRFQGKERLRQTGVVNRATFERLVAPMIEVLKRSYRSSSVLHRGVLHYARAHLAEHPVEVGGQNRGPWVRLYMKGNEGAEWPWCAGFVCFVLHQATDSLDLPMPLRGSFSCDSLAAQARANALFLAERDADDDSVRPGSIFLVRRTSSDWTHTGFVVEALADLIRTIEGNTNDEGSREGYEVCARARGYRSKDFIVLPQ